MDIITKEKVLEIANDEHKNICFSRWPKYHMPKKIFGKNYYGIIEMPFGNENIFSPPNFPEYLFPHPKYPNSRTRQRHIQNEEEFERIRQWCEERKVYVYSRNCLSVSGALGYRREAPADPLSQIGELVYTAKENKHKEGSSVIERLIDLSIKFRELHPAYKNANRICAIPSQKEPNFPEEIARGLSKRLDIQEITSNFELREKISVKDKKSFEERWESWENTHLRFGGNVRGMRILLVDDNYQSGITLQYVAMILQKAGAEEVYGLAMAKNLKDKVG